MNTRPLGNTGLQLSEIGFGAWAIGGDWLFGWGPQDEDEAIAAIHRALELGVNWIDTAAVYGLGRSEQLVARATAGIRKEVIIATKCSLVWNEKGDVSDNLRRESVLRECEASLIRLNTNYIDLYQIHWPNDERHIEEGWEAVNQLIAEGKVRFGGMSNFNVVQMERAQKLHPIASLQPPYSMLRRGVEGEAFDYCRRNHIGVVAYSPMQSGILTEKFDLTRLAPRDWRRRSTEFREPNLTINLQFVDKLRPIAAKYEKTIAQLAIAWTLRWDVVTSSIVGGRRPSQIEETIGGAGWTIEPEDLSLIDEALEERVVQLKKAGAEYRQ